MFHVEHRRMDYHLHTNHSMDGRQTMPELCETMMARGVQEIALTEHIEPGHPEEEMDVPPVWADWFAEIARCRAAYPALVIRSGIEIGDNPLCRAETKALLDTLPLDFRLLSLHLVNGVDCYDSEKYFAGKTRAQAYREYAEAKAESILDWEDFDSVAHIGYVAKFSIYTGKERALVYVYRQEALAALLAQADYQAVEVDTPYCQKLVKVAALRGEDAPAYPAMGDDPRGEMLNHAQAHQLTAALEICGSGVDDVVGTVEDVRGGLVRVRQWTDDGDADGESAVAVDAVTAIFVGSEQLTYLDLLRRV